MRIAFLDEAGASKVSEEPYFVVAGVLVEPDGQYDGIAEYLNSIVEQLFPGQKDMPLNSVGKPFIFHAKDIWHGSGFFPRARWSLLERMKIFRMLCEIPRSFNLTVVYGAIDRALHIVELSKLYQPTVRAIASDAHAQAFFIAVQSIDKWMRDFAPNERAILFVEDRKEVKQHLDIFHGCYTDRLSGIVPKDVFKTNHIVEPIAYMRKEQSPLLQIADHCAFIIKRDLQGCTKITPFYENIRSFIFSSPIGPTSLQRRVAVSDIEVFSRGISKRR